MPNPKLITDALTLHRCNTVEDLINVLRTTNLDIVAGNCHLISSCYHQQQNFVLALKYAKLAVQVEANNSYYWLHYLKVSFSLQSEPVSKSIYDQIVRAGLVNESLISETYKDHEFNQDDEKMLINRNSLQQLTKLFNDQNFNDALIAAKNLQTLYPEDATLKNIIAAIHLMERRYELAEKLAFEAVTKNKILSSGYNNLGLATRSLGKYEEALKAFEACCFLEPKNVTNMMNWAKTLEIIGNFKSAVEIYEKLIKLSSSKESFLRAAICYDKCLSYTKELNILKKAKLKHPNDHEIQSRLGVSLLKLHQIETAIDELQLAVDLNGRDVHSLNNLGVALTKAKKFEESISVFLRAINADSAFAPAHNNLGNSYKQIMDYKNAITSLKLAVQLDKSFFDPHFNLGLTYQSVLDYENSVKSFEHALLLCPEQTDVYYDLGNSYLKLNKPSNAIECYNKCLKANKQHWQAWNSLGNAHADLGNFDTAINCYERTLSININEMSTHRHLSLFKKYEHIDDQILFLLDAVKSPELKFKDIAHVHFTLAKAFEDMNQLTHAFEHLTLGNEARRRELNYSFPHERLYFEKLTSAAAKLGKLNSVTTHSEIKHSPVFIIGLPRSGTTLIEQIISSHSAVKSLGELNYVRSLVEDMVLGAQAISIDNLDFFRSQYLHKVSVRAQGHQYFIDKMPHNFRFIPFIQRAFPDCKIVLVTRDRRATCWSNFRQYFAGGALGYSCRISDIIKYHGMYTSLLKTFRDLGFHWIDVDYDLLTTQPEETIRRLIDQLGLSWQEACLKPELNTSAVQTASQRQIRNKIYTGSSQNWRKYERQLRFSGF